MVGRWIQSDPLRFKRCDLNFYVYVNNDPINYIDPNGLETCVLVTRKGLGIGNHAALMATSGGENNGGWIYGPAGSFGPANGSGEAGLLDGPNVTLEGFIEHQRLEGDTTEENDCNTRTRTV